MSEYIDTTEYVNDKGEAACSADDANLMRSYAHYNGIYINWPALAGKTIVARVFSEPYTNYKVGSSFQSSVLKHTMVMLGDNKNWYKATDITVIGVRFDQAKDDGFPTGFWDSFSLQMKKDMLNGEFSRKSLPHEPQFPKPHIVDELARSPRRHDLDWYPNTCPQCHKDMNIVHPPCNNTACPHQFSVR